MSFWMTLLYWRKGMIDFIKGEGGKMPEQEVPWKKKELLI